MFRAHVQVLSFLLLSLFLFNCSVSKRHYRKGFYITKLSHSRSNPDKQVDYKPKQSLLSSNVIETKLDQHVEGSHTELIASANEVGTYLLKSLKLRTLPDGNDSCADVLIFRDGTELTVKVVEVVNGSIKYLPCNSLDGPLRVLNGDKIFMIKYANGTKEVMREPVKTMPSYEQKKAPLPKKINGLALAAFICSTLWFFVLPAFVALILGTIALNQFTTHPEKYKGKWMAKFAVIVGGIFSFLYLLSFAF